MKLVESFDLGNAVDGTDFIPVIQRAVRKYGIDNIRLYVTEKTVQGYSMTYIKLCCYKKEIK